MEDIKPDVTIGVAVRYEQPDKLRRFVYELSAAAHLLDEHTDSEVCFCLNGSSGHTKEFLQNALQELHDPDLHFNYLESPAGKIRAQETIARNRKLDGFILFVDADVQFEETLFLRMYNFLITQPDVHACYADVSALPSVAGGFFGILQDSYYRNRHHMPTRVHLHGRCFMLRSWVNDFGARGDSSAETNIDSDDKLKLSHGPIVDDIHYSRVLIHQYGISSIARVPDTHVKFIPPHSAAELYRDSCRTEFELFRLNILFPEHARIEQDVIRKITSIRRHWQSLLSMGLPAAAYLLIEKAMRYVARLKAQKQMASLSEGGISPEVKSNTAPQSLRDEASID